MANLEFLSNVVHQGIILKAGMIVSDVNHDLSLVGANLIARGLARETNVAATHTAALVNGAQEAMPVDASSSAGQVPNAESDAQRKARLQAAQQPASPQVQNQVHEQADKESTPVQTAAQPTDEQHQGPSADDVARTAAEVN